MPKILHLVATAEELAAQAAATLSGKWDLENDCRIGSVTRFASSTDPRAVSGGGCRCGRRVCARWTPLFVVTVTTIVHHVCVCLFVCLWDTR
jgi:hypothetical protein